MLKHCLPILNEAQKSITKLSHLLPNGRISLRTIVKIEHGEHITLLIHTEVNWQRTANVQNIKAKKDYFVEFNSYIKNIVGTKFYQFK